MLRIAVYWRRRLDGTNSRNGNKNTFMHVKFAKVSFTSLLTSHSLHGNSKHRRKIYKSRLWLPDG